MPTTEIHVHDDDHDHDHDHDVFAPTQFGSLDDLSDFLIEGYWGARRSIDTSSSNVISVNLTGLGTDGAALARAALEAWETVADITFTEVSTGGQIGFTEDQNGAITSMSFIGEDIQSATVNIGTDRLDRYGSSYDSYAFQTYIHEIGHALGLGHLGNYDGGADYDDDATFRNDSWSVSIMSYFNQTENSTDTASYARLGTAMIADIAAIQAIYGAADDGSATAGDTVWGAYSTLDTYLGRMFAGMFEGQEDDLFTGNAFSFTIWDQGGVDTLNVRPTSTNNIIRLEQEATSDVNGAVGNITIARGAVIENATSGSGHDQIFGTLGANSLRAGGGNDTVTARDGNDFVDGEAGHDVVYAGTGADTVYGGAGNDALWVAAGNDLVLGGDGNDVVGAGGGADVVYAGAGADTVYGGSGNDVVGGAAGADAIYAGGGNDTVYAGAGQDVAFGGNGDDVVYTGADNDVLYGGAGNDTVGTGNGDDDVRSGDGNDVIYAGAGSDTVNAGSGNDTIYAGNGDDVLTGGAGADVFRYVGGNDIISDFDLAEDRIDLRGLAAVTDFSDLVSNHLSSGEDGVRITAHNGDELLLSGISAGDLEANDFLF